MDYTHSLFVMDAIKRNDTIETLKLVTSDALKGFGATNFAYAVFDLKTLTPEQSIYTYPEAWVQEYLEKNYQSIDPVFELGFEAASPFVWGASLRSARPEVLYFWKRARTFGIEQGLSIPLRCPKSKRAFFTIASTAANKCFAELLSSDVSRKIVVTIAQQFHFRARGIESHRVPSITERERQVLKLLSFAWSNAEIANFLKISKDSVSDFVSSLMDKFGAPNRVSLLVEAERLGAVF